MGTKTSPAPAYVDPAVRDYVSVDLSKARRVFTCGDLHGRLDLLIAELARVGFDADAGDWLIMIGDLLDRGPAVLETRDFLDENPHVLWLRGNHEQILQGALFEAHRTDEANGFTLLRNGGDWLMNHVPADMDFGSVMAELCGGNSSFVSEEILDFARTLGAAPVAVRVRTPGGRIIGLVHADVPADDWATMARALLSDDVETRGRMASRCMWSRDRIADYRRHKTHGALAEFDCTVEGVDHVFFGHTKSAEPITHSNCSWIDTGAYKTGRLTLVDIDEWVAAL
ncbi:metallophosphoesterase [Sphingomonas sp. 3-13AW]|uniref:metallophosphoesterase n=1 Tax=Sphingomonas sp. 3-13AW TaxID=3050450 RepID=UPI003BB7BFB3